VPSAPPYDWKSERPDDTGAVVDLRRRAWEWSFEVDGALALDPAERRLRPPETSVTVPRMAWPDAARLAAPPARRDEADARAKRARRLAALVVLAALAIATLVLAGFGAREIPAKAPLTPAPAHRLLPSGPPRPQAVAVHDTLRILLPISQNRVTAIGYHGAGAGALQLEPVGTQANAGLLQRLFHRLAGESGSSMSYYLVGGGSGPDTSGLDVGAPLDTDVYAPVDGTVITMSDHVVNGAKYGVRIDIQPSGSPGIVVSISNLRPDPALTVGSTVSAAKTKIGRVIDLSSVERAALARYTQDKGYHVHVDVRPTASLAR
jgi:murein DD-endopeptidase MepM/ murein hydrolase activator NlpD